jgi:hypothetical protein
MWLAGGQRLLRGLPDAGFQFPAADVAQPGAVRTDQQLEARPGRRRALRFDDGCQDHRLAVLDGNSQLTQHIRHVLSPFRRLILWLAAVRRLNRP